MDNLRLLKSVVFRTKSFKALLLGGLIIGFVIIQYPYNVNKEEISTEKNEESIPLNFDEFSSNFIKFRQKVLKLLSTNCLWC